MERIQRKIEQGGDEVIHRFWIPMIPTAQGRPRACRFGNRAKVYKDNKSRNYEDTLTALLIQQKPERADRGIPVTLWVSFFMPRPQYHYKKDGSLKDKYRYEQHMNTPDLDNLIKALKDAAKGVLWHDDRQVVKVIAMKAYEGTDGPGTLCNVEWPGTSQTTGETECTQK